MLQIQPVQMGTFTVVIELKSTSALEYKKSLDLKIIVKNYDNKNITESREKLAFSQTLEVKQKSLELPELHAVEITAVRPLKVTIE